MSRYALQPFLKLSINLYFCLLVLVPLSAWAQTSGSVYNTPIYSHSAKSYFELVKVSKNEDPKSYTPEFTWAEAQAYASRRVYKGAHGRLAVVKSAEVHSLIVTELKPSTYTWIGLRYFCDKRKLEWSDGSTHLKQDFSLWHANWNQSAGVECQERGYMSVAYLPPNEGLRWVAKGGGKKYYDLIVEFPTGRP
jgi:hypothetical protein